ncbi:MAG: hypothetical protein DMG42_37095 [Acidobacteria bacterium]|nr:MAG: hypothetical protein DMG42_37095 [Acidobacteriota bacterium]
MSLPSGTKLGPYEIQSPLGAGGMGEVYRARDTRLERTVAIKVLPNHLSSDPESKQRFEREARAISSLNHPHICALYDIGTRDIRPGAERHQDFSPSALVLPLGRPCLILLESPSLKASGSSRCEPESQASSRSPQPANPPENASTAWLYELCPPFGLGTKVHATKRHKLTHHWGPESEAYLGPENGRPLRGKSANCQEHS